MVAVYQTRDPRNAGWQINVRCRNCQTTPFSFCSLWLWFRLPGFHRLKKLIVLSYSNNINIQGKHIWHAFTKPQKTKENSLKQAIYDRKFRALRINEMYNFNKFQILRVSSDDGKWNKNEPEQTGIISICRLQSKHTAKTCIVYDTQRFRDL